MTMGNMTAEKTADEIIAERVATIPPLEWLTGSARDVVRIAVCLAGFDVKELVGRLARVKSLGERLNAATVYRVLDELTAEWDARHGAAWRISR